MSSTLVMFYEYDICFSSYSFIQMHTPLIRSPFVSLRFGKRHIMGYISEIACLNSYSKWKITSGLFKCWKMSERYSNNDYSTDIQKYSLKIFMTPCFFLESIPPENLNSSFDFGFKFSGIFMSFYILINVEIHTFSYQLQMGVKTSLQNLQKESFRFIIHAQSCSL